MKQLIQLKDATSLVAIALLLAFGLTPQAKAVVPAPDGGYPGRNTAEGQSALLSLSSGTNNTAVGWFSLKSVTTGGYNTALGGAALFANTGDGNTATGAGALFKNTTADYNTATGLVALYNNTTGQRNTATGYQALFYNTSGGGNTAIGVNALLRNTVGFYNTAIGNGAISNIAGSGNTALGENAGSGRLFGNNNIDIGANVQGVQSENNTIRIGNANITDTLISGIYQQHLFAGLPVFIASNGTLFTGTSSKRFKQEMKPMDKASEALFALKPVTFRYKKKIDPVGTMQFGLVAEDVEKVNPDLVVHDENGKVDGVRYDQVNAMLLNEFLKEHQKVEQLTKDFESKLTEQQKQIDALTAGLQKVSAQLELSKSTPRTVVGNH